MADGQRQELFRADLSASTAATICVGAIDDMATNRMLSRRPHGLASEADGVVGVFINRVRSR